MKSLNIYIDTRQKYCTVDVDNGDTLVQAFDFEEVHLFYDGKVIVLPPFQKEGLTELTDDDESAIEALLSENGKFRERLTDWETNFLESLLEQGWISVKQKEILDRIWEEKTR